MATIEERCKKFATRNCLNSDDEIVATIVDEMVYNNALVVANTIKSEMIEKACEWLRQCITFQHPDYRHPVPFFDEEDIEDFKNFMKQ